MLSLCTWTTRQSMLSVLLQMKFTNSHSIVPELTQQSMLTVLTWTKVIMSWLLTLLILNCSTTTVTFLMKLQCTLHRKVLLPSIAIFWLQSIAIPNAILNMQPVCNTCSNTEKYCNTYYNNRNINNQDTNVWASVADGSTDLAFVW